MRNTPVLIKLSLAMSVLAALACLRPGGRLVINAIRKESGDRGLMADISYEEHPDLVPVPDVNPAVYLVRLDNGRQIEVPSNLLVWEPILHAEAVNSAGQFNDFLAALNHHMTVRPQEWNAAGGIPGLLDRLIAQIGVREMAAQQAREQLVPRWGIIAVAILEAVAPASWSEEED